MEFKHYGEIIHKIRQDRNMTLKEAAGDVITPNNLSRFEKGLSSIKVDTFFEILSRFNLDGDDFNEVLHIQDENAQRAKQIINALIKNDRIKARKEKWLGKYHRLLHTKISYFTNSRKENRWIGSWWSRSYSLLGRLYI